MGARAVGENADSHRLRSNPVAEASGKYPEKCTRQSKKWQRFQVTVKTCCAQRFQTAKQVI
jgi:hypothetical protein